MFKFICNIVYYISILSIISNTHKCYESWLKLDNTDTDSINEFMQKIMEILMNLTSNIIYLYISKRILSICEENERLKQDIENIVSLRKYKML